jgi:hypothetical protein
MSQAHSQYHKVLDGTGYAYTDDEPNQAGHVPELNSQNRPYQRSCSADGCKVMAEQDPSIRRMVILSVIKLDGGGNPVRIQDGDSGGKKSAVVAVGHGHGREDSQENRHGMHKLR